MPSVPDTDDVTRTGRNSIADGAVYGLGITAGEAVLGGIGHGVGGVVAGASIGGSKGETLSTLAVSNAINRTVLGGTGGGGQSAGGVK